mgnify:CR=1 FL=1
MSATSVVAGARVSYEPERITMNVERWGIFEHRAHGPAEGNPFTEVTFGAVFESAGHRIEIPGFYDGQGVYRVRFMPDREGAWSFTTRSNRPELHGRTGSFHCVPARPGNHGPVRPDHRCHFSHEDGSPCFIMGTTAYAWTYRPEEIRAQSLQSFSRYRFNKIRMLVFPKEYGDGKTVDASYDPPFFPYEGAPGAWDYTRFNPAFFQNYEARVNDLLQHDIQADVILFHPYDRKWLLPQGMTEVDDLHYTRYLVARLAAYRNVWWSLANEFDLFRAPQFREKNWDAIGECVAAADPYRHPISIHNWPFIPPYPNRPWMSHVSYQHPNTYSMLLHLRQTYGKPAINDEYQYEGTVPHGWGNCTPELEFRRHWAATMAGGYATHGEVLPVRGGIRDYFWAYGGTLQGQSAPRLAYMRQIVESLPFQSMAVNWLQTDGRDLYGLQQADNAFLFFIGPDYKDRHGVWIGSGRETPAQYNLIVHDIWNCVETERRTVGKGHTRLALPPWAAVTALKIR